MSNLKEYISYVTKHGLARTNRFKIIIPLPAGIIPAEETERSSSRLQELFGDVIKTVRSFSGSNTSEMTRGLEVMCSQTELPGKMINVSETKYNGDVYKVASSVTYGQHQFVFKVTKDMYEKNVLDSWMKKMINPITHELAYMEEYSTDVTIFQLDMQDNPVHGVILRDAFPVTLNPLTLSNLEQNNTHELMVQFAYKRWENLDLDDSGNGVSSLSQTPLGPYLSPILSNPAVQKGLEFIKDRTGLDISGEAVNIYNQIDDIVKNTTGTSINKSASLLNQMKAAIGLNDKISPLQQAQIIQYLDDLLDKIS